MFRLVAVTVSLLSVTLMAACTTAQPPAGGPRADGPNPPPPGSSWALRDQNSGSFGSSSGQRRLSALGEQTWQGHKVRAYLDGTVTSYTDVTTGALVARVRGGTPSESFDPPFGWQWPIFPGKSWLLTWRYTNHDSGRSFDGIQTWFRVDSYEEVKTPAGTFKAFRVSTDDGAFRTTSWWSPDLGISVKFRGERYGTHFQGPGIQESELLSYDVKR